MKRVADYSAFAKTITVVILSLALIAICLLSFNYYKDVQAEEALAKRSAIPASETASVAEMLENLGISHSVSEPKIEVTVSKITDKIHTYSTGDISLYKNFNRQIATIALNPLDSTLSKDDAFNIANVRVEWQKGQSTIRLEGDADGWKTITWKSPERVLTEEIQNHPKNFTLKMAENHKFSA
ncbi:hypothetical protein IJI94_03465 [Candidatus Saccharibacteria bacterium]|nr:hypothetical protein [Candidatus Saccharibacteria bacterium]